MDFQGESLIHPKNLAVAMRVGSPKSAKMWRFSRNHMWIIMKSALSDFKSHRCSIFRPVTEACSANGQLLATGSLDRILVDSVETGRNHLGWLKLVETLEIMG